MLFTLEKSDTSNQNRERRFFTCEENDTSNQKPQRCVSFTGPAFFRRKKKKSRKVYWNSIVYFTIDEET